MKRPKLWIYKGVFIYPAEYNSSGIRWFAYCGVGNCLRSDTKEGMKRLVDRDRATRKYI